MTSWKAEENGVAGYIFNASPSEPAECEECECNAFDGIQTVFWTADRKQTFADDEVTFDVFDILRNGGFKNKAQLCIKIGENVKLAGFGVYNPATQTLKSANGFFAGTIAAPKCAGAWSDKECKYGEDTDASVFKPCALTDPVKSEAAIVYGRWTMTYKADKVRQIESGQHLRLPPSDRLRRRVVVLRFAKKERKPGVLRSRAFVYNERLRCQADKPHP